MRIERSAVIPAPLDRVFAFVSDPRNDTLWCPKVQTVEQAAGEGPAPGAEYRVVHRPVPILAAREMRYTLVDWDPPRAIHWRENDGHDVIEVTYTLEASGEHTRFTQTDEADLGAPRMLHPFMRMGIGRDLGIQLKRLAGQFDGH